MITVNVSASFSFHKNLALLFGTMIGFYMQQQLLL